MVTIAAANNHYTVTVMMGVMKKDFVDVSLFLW